MHSNIHIFPSQHISRLPSVCFYKRQLSANHDIHYQQGTLISDIRSMALQTRLYSSIPPRQKGSQEAKDLATPHQERHRDSTEHQAEPVPTISLTGRVGGRLQDLSSILQSNERLALVMLSTGVVMTGHGCVTPVLPLFVTSMGAGATQVTSFTWSMLLISCRIDRLHIIYHV